MDYKEYIKINNIDLNESDPIFDASNLITEARLYSGLSQAELAKKIGTQQPSIARAEKGSVVPSIQFLQKIANAIGTYLVSPKFGFMIEREKSSHINVTLNYGYNNKLLFSTDKALLPEATIIRSNFQFRSYTDDSVNNEITYSLNEKQNA